MSINKKDKSQGIEAPTPILSTSLSNGVKPPRFTLGAVKWIVLWVVGGMTLWTGLMWRIFVVEAKIDTMQVQLVQLRLDFQVHSTNDWTVSDMDVWSDMFRALNITNTHSPCLPDARRIALAMRRVP